MDYFTAVLGAPPAVRKRVEGQPIVECIWVFRDAFVQAFVEIDGVIAYAVTTRSRWFRPRFSSPTASGIVVGERVWLWLLPERIKQRVPYRRQHYIVPFFRIRLGRTRFADLPEVGAVRVSVGNRLSFYEEAHYFGNPGHYQTYVFGVRNPLWSGGYDLTWEPDALTETEPPPEVVELRSRARITSILIVGAHQDRERLPSGVGAEPDSVRIFAA